MLEKAQSCWKKHNSFEPSVIDKIGKNQVYFDSSQT